MKSILFFFTLTFFSSPLFAENIELADIGLKGSPFYIGIEIIFAESNEEDSYRFNLCRPTPYKCLAISNTEAGESCQYSETELKGKIDVVKSDIVKQDFSWIFLRSGDSQADLPTFYKDFTSVLKSVRVDCKSENLQELIDQLTISKG